MSGSRLVQRIRAEIYTRPWLRRARNVMRLAGRYYRYACLCGPVRAGRYLLAERRGMTGLVGVDHRSLGRRVWLRIGSTDINVAGKILLEREYELPLSRDPAVIVDAGAYTGISSLWFAARYPSATVVALEPDAANFRLLRLNVAAETRIVPLREALWREDGMVRISASDDGAWANRVTNHETADNVRATTVGTLMRRLGLDRIDLLKLDIEGSEVDLFEGDAGEWLTSVDAIAVETHERFRANSREAVLRACAGFTATAIGSETLFLARPSARP